MVIPFAPWILWLAGQDGPIPPDEIAGAVVLCFVFWSIAVLAAWHAGGVTYVVETLCWALLVVPLVPWTLAPLAGWPVPHGEFLARLLVATLTAWTVAALLAWRFELWPFEPAAIRGQRHPVAVFHAEPPKGDYEPYLVAMCECDWMGGFHGDAEAVFADAREHS